MNQMDFDKQQLEEQIMLLRTRLTSLAERERMATIKSGQYARVMEKMLIFANGPVYHDLKSRHGVRFADFLVEHQEDLLDLFTGPFKRKIKALQERREQEAVVATQPAAQQSAPPAPAVERQSAAQTPPAVTVTNLDLSPRHADVLQIIGDTGEFLIPPILVSVSQRWGKDPADKTLRQDIYKITSALAEMGLINTSKLALSIPNEFKSPIGSRTIALTPQGQAWYEEKFGRPPADRLAPFVARYRTVEAGLLIRLARRAIEQWNERPDRRWDMTVIDAVWEDDDAFARIPGAQKSYHAPDGNGYAQPDLILEAAPASGKGTAWQGVVEVERGQYKTPDLHAKWRRAMLCYPPLVTVVVAPNNKTRDRLYQAWKELAPTASKRHSLDEFSALFYTLNELEGVGILSPDQLKSWIFRQKKLREKQSEGNTLSSDEEAQMVSIPKLWNQARR